MPLYKNFGMYRDSEMKLSVVIICVASFYFLCSRHGGFEGLILESFEELQFLRFLVVACGRNMPLEESTKFQVPVKFFAILIL